jgi:hypothetical protein
MCARLRVRGCDERAVVRRSGRRLGKVAVMAGVV